jgi:hypothetical protein
MGFGSRTQKNVLDYASGNSYVHALVGDSFTASSYSFTRNGWTQGSKISNALETFEEIDDSGKVVVMRETEQSVDIEGTFLSREAGVRNSVTAGSASAYTLVIVGATLDDSGTTKKEIFVFPRVTFSKALDYEIGGKARIGYKARAFAPDGDVVVDISSISGTAGITTASITVPANKHYITLDVV